MAGVVSIPWYATLFRGDRFAEALGEIAPLATRYGATEYRVYRSRDDMYRFNQMATFEDKADFEAYWYSEDFNAWRTVYSGWYQIPVLYNWHELIYEGGLKPEVAVTNGD
jgi:hypothetical protein